MHNLNKTFEKVNNPVVSALVSSYVGLGVRKETSVTPIGRLTDVP